ncbi:hypothetical protein BD779DRAFT_1435329 [Infundibulicybe gibba]|nr:hypothetical protein BD779DRAFT_1435329 [Infundibulicybe gibba]
MGSASPSVALEKGAYRMRAPSNKPLVSDTPTRSRSYPPARRSNTNQLSQSSMALLVILLAVGCLTCFGTAYYLFTSRWGTHANPDPPTHADGRIQVVTFDDALRSNYTQGERFLAYLPHSGFHNQRIALENALVLSQLLNRTLIIPPARLGSKPIRYLSYGALYDMLALSDKNGFLHCSRTSKYLTLPSECIDFFDYTHVSWDWLFSIKESLPQLRMIPRWNMTEAWLYDYLNTSAAECMVIQDNDAYHFRFLDTLGDRSPAKNKYLEDIHIPRLATSSTRLIHIGTLFGSSRLRLKNPYNLAVRRKTRQAMDFTNPVMIDVADSVARWMSGPYLGAHIRLGDGKFATDGGHNARIIWWKLVHLICGFSVQESLGLERKFRIPPWGSALDLREPSGLDLHHEPAILISPAGPSVTLSCRGPRHTLSHLQILNMPLFISTDIEEPNNNSFLMGFIRTFPCTFFLSDFQTQISPLNRLQNGRDMLILAKFIRPLIDAMVVARAWRVVGTEGSTFSRYVEDVLWRRYHGAEIIQRG